MGCLTRLTPVAPVHGAAAQAASWDSGRVPAHSGPPCPGCLRCSRKTRRAAPAVPRLRRGANTLRVLALPELVELAAVRQVELFCDSRVPEHARDEVRLEAVVRGNAITLIERRAPWRGDIGPEWSTLKIAQLRYAAKAGEWSLYCCNRNEQWFPYTEAHAHSDVGPLLEAVDADPTGIFWG
jgi:Protein of unknown function (DUF3024)